MRENVVVSIAHQITIQITSELQRKLATGMNQSAGGSVSHFFLLAERRGLCSLTHRPMTSHMETASVQRYSTGIIKRVYLYGHILLLGLEPSLLSTSARRCTNGEMRWQPKGGIYTLLHELRCPTQLVHHRWESNTTCMVNRFTTREVMNHRCKCFSLSHLCYDSEIQTRLPAIANENSLALTLLKGGNL